MTPILFSIVTVTRNAARHLSGCLESVLAQTYTETEHIIIDGASTDGTADLVRRLAGARTQFVSEPDEGIYDAMNKGIARATGAYVLFLGADDRFADSKVLADTAAFLEQSGRPDLVYGNLEVRQTNGRTSVFQPPPPPEALDFLIYGCLPHQSTFAHRGLFDGPVGLFNTQYRVHGDYEWYLRAVTAGGVEIRHMDRTVGSFYAGGTSSQLEKSQAELYAIQNSFPIYQRPEWMSRRLNRFQQQTLAYRLELDTYRSAARIIGLGSSIKKALRRATRQVGALWRDERHGS